MCCFDVVRQSFTRFRAMYRAMGARFFVTIVMIEHLLQAFVFGGGAGGLVGVPILFLLREYGTLTASRMQVLKTIAVSPWALKPLFGIVSDSLYIGGYNRIPYILSTLLLATVSCILLAFTWPVSPVIATLLFFLMFLQIAVADLLLEAGYIPKTTAKPEISPDLVSFVDMGSCAFQLASIGLVGLLIYYVPLQYIYLVPVPVFLATLYPIYQNWIDDQEYRYTEAFLVDAVDLGHVDSDGGGDAAPPKVRRSDNRLTNLCCGRFCWYFNLRADGTDVIGAPMTPVVGLDIHKLRHNWRIFTLAVIIGAISLVTSVVGLADVSTLPLFVFSVVGAPLMIGCFFALVDPQVARVQAFVIIQNMFTVSVESAAFFFYTDTPEQYPEGPHFSSFFYVTVMGCLATVLALVGVVTYNMFMSHWSYRRTLLVTNLLYILVSLTNVPFFLRWNVAWGLPDWLFVIGSEALQVVTGVWTSLPFRVMMLQLCPQGLEATMYALLAGSSNLGNALAQYQGAFLLDVLGVKPRGQPNESAQFDNLWIVVLINTLLPIIPLFFLCFLIPDTGQRESLSPATAPQRQQQQQQQQQEEQEDVLYGAYGAPIDSEREQELEIIKV